MNLSKEEKAAIIFEMAMPLVVVVVLAVLMFFIAGCATSFTAVSVDPDTGVITGKTKQFGVGNKSVEAQKSIEFLVEKDDEGFHFEGSGNGNLSATQEMNGIAEGIAAGVARGLK